VEPRILGTRLRSTRAYRDYCAYGVFGGGHASVSGAPNFRRALADSLEETHTAQPSGPVRQIHHARAVCGWRTHLWTTNLTSLGSPPSRLHITTYCWAERCAVRTWKGERKGYSEGNPERSDAGRLASKAHSASPRAGRPHLGHDRGLLRRAPAAHTRTVTRLHRYSINQKVSLRSSKILKVVVPR
jgi:hypothetical protein